MYRHNDPPGRVVVIGGVVIDQMYDTPQGTSHSTFAAPDDWAAALGPKHEFGRVQRYVGGGAANAATSFARQGFATSVLCRVGDDFDGEEIRRVLVREKIDVSLMQRDESAATGTAVISDFGRAQPLILACRGANLNLELPEAAAARITASDIIHVCTLSGDAMNVLPHVCRLHRRSGSILAVNPGGAQLASDNIGILLSSLSSIDVLILNQSEAQRLWANARPPEAGPAHRAPSERCLEFPGPDDDWTRRHPVVDFILGKGVRYLLVTMDSRGAVLASRDNRAFAPAMKVGVVSPLGAGDAFGTTVVAGLATDMNVSRVLGRANRNAASVLANASSRKGLLTHRQLASGDAADARRTTSD